jgi:hypothetical protein
MTNFLYNETGYALKSGSVVTPKTYAKYFEHFIKIYSGKDYATFNKVELVSKCDEFVIEYSVPADWCGICDNAGVTEGVCDGYGEGHNDPHQAFIGYKLVDLYTYE